MSYQAKNFNKFKVWKRDDYTCQYCGLEMRLLYKLWRLGRIKRHEALLTVDHIKPRSKGGSWEVENLVTSCVFCNSRKGSDEIKIPIPTRSQKIIYRLLDMLINIGEWAKKKRFSNSVFEKSV